MTFNSKLKFRRRLIVPMIQLLKKALDKNKLFLLGHFLAFPRIAHLNEYPPPRQVATVRSYIIDMVGKCANSKE